jgi:hypothetical protein
MASHEAKQILQRMTPQVGDEGMALARSLIHGYAGLARGRDGAACDAYLARQVLSGILTIENESWIYRDPHGRRVIAGTLADRVIPGIARIGEMLHAHAGLCQFDRYELADMLSNSAKRVSREIRWITNPVGLSVPAPAES